MRREEEPQSPPSRLIDELCEFLFASLRFPAAARERLPAISPAGIASLMMGISLSLMLSGWISFVIGCMMMPWVLGMVMLLYLIGLVSSVSMLWKVALGGAAASQSPAGSSQKGNSA